MITPELADLIRRAVAEYKSVTPAQKAELHARQRKSWARAELAFGSDADEARYRAAGEAERECLDGWMTARADWIMRGRP